MISSLWKESRPLTGLTIIMLVAFVLTLLGLLIDPRYITGMPAWLKPAKFAISSAIFSASIAWLFGYLPRFPRSKSWAGGGLAAILLIENAIIDFQAARGTTSHFNIATQRDAILFGIMGISIGILWLLSVWIVVLLFRQNFKDRAWGWALRLGMSISVLGSASGGLMTVPTAEQRAAIARDERIQAAGGHTVGAPDGGPGVAGVGWSKQHGDLRIPHFIGLHALQIVPLLVSLRRRRSTRFVFAVAGSYVCLYAILLWQALKGESIVQPSTATLAVLGVWLLAALAAVIPLERNGYAMEVLHER